MKINVYKKIYEQEKQRDKAKYKCSLLNDTKWREIISVLIKHQIYRIEAAYIDNEKYCVGFIPEKNKLTEKYIMDPGFLRGPTHYDEIYAIRIPYISDNGGQIDGLQSITEGESKKLLKDLKSLGELPIEISDEFITIKGYSK